MCAQGKCDNVRSTGCVMHIDRANPEGQQTGDPIIAGVLAILFSCAGQEVLCGGGDASKCDSAVSAAALPAPDLVTGWLCLSMRGKREREVEAAICLSPSCAAGFQQRDVAAACCLDPFSQPSPAHTRV